MSLFNVVTVQWEEMLGGKKNPVLKSNMHPEQRKERATLIFVISLVALLCSV